MQMDLSRWSAWAQTPSTIDTISQAVSGDSQRQATGGTAPLDAAVTGAVWG
jgi:hypothetical protein